ncbi:MAG: hypothetical protein ACLFUS_04510 [Candidatus Sumerlaeia bacterium]
MIRQFRKLKRELAAQWGRLSAFMRFCAGLAIAIAMSYYVINAQVKPLQNKRMQLEEELHSAEAPVYIPPTEEDNEYQETKMKIESLSNSLERERLLTTEAIGKARTLAKSEEGRVVAAFDSLVFEQGLDLLKRERNQSESVAGRMTVSEYAYTLAGTFEQIQGFLRAAQSFPHLCQIADMTIRAFDPLAEDADARTESLKSPARTKSPRTSLLQLEFLLKLYFTEETAP